MMELIFKGAYTPVVRGLNNTTSRHPKLEEKSIGHFKFYGMRGAYFGHADIRSENSMFRQASRENSRKTGTAKVCWIISSEWSNVRIIFQIVSFWYKKRVSDSFIEVIMRAMCTITIFRDNRHPRGMSQPLVPDGHKYE